MRRGPTHADGNLLVAKNKVLLFCCVCVSYRWKDEKRTYKGKNTRDESLLRPEEEEEEEEEERYLVC
jgi:hypothetical protein